MESSREHKVSSVYLVLAKSWVQGEAVGRCIAERDLGKCLEIIKPKLKEFRLYLTINVAIKKNLGYVEDGKDVNRFLLLIIIITSDVDKNQLTKAQESESPDRNFNCLYNSSQEIGQWG